MRILDFSRCLLGIGALAVVLTACGGSQPPVGSPSTVSQNQIRGAMPQWEAQHLARAECPQVVGRPSCYALRSLIVPAGCSPSSTCGYTPAELQTAYGLTPYLKNGSGTKIAVIEAGDLANAASDLSTYRTQYNLGTASFFKYNENGQQSNYPPSCEGYGWCGETALDIDMISASCPKCTIYLMEAKDGSSISDFEQAEKEAVTLGATIVSNSWGCPNSWDCGDTSFGNYFSTKGVAYLASSGDSGFNTVGGPAVLDSVVAVGGTQLEKSGSTYKEVLWPDASAGCSSPSEVGSPGVPKPSWQHDPECAYRSVADVSSEAGCSPGVAVYVDLYGGWNGICGTSVASPFTAGVVGVKGNAGSWKANGGERFWDLTKRQHKNYFHHPTGGTGTCGYICGDGRYKKYYSGPGGWGTPNGTKAY
jgi:subtilase family serine protease